MVKCAFCKLTFVSVSHLKVHFPCRHGGSIFTRYICGEDNCGRSFDEWRALRKHLISFHKCLDKVVDPIPKRIAGEPSVIEHVESVDDSGVFDEGMEVISEPDLSASDFKVAYGQSVELLVAKLYKNPSIPRNFVQTLIDDMDMFLNGGFIDILKAKVLCALQSAKAPEPSVTDIVQIFDCLKDPFKGLHTDYRRMEYFKANQCYIPPVTFTISESRPKPFNSKNGVIIKQVKTTGQFVPLRLVLKKLFELPGALSETLAYVQHLKSSSVFVRSNVIQSQRWQSKLSLFKESDIVFPLDFFYDDVEPNADLGPHSETLGAGYILIPVLPPACLSKLENILLALIIDADDRKSTTPGKISYNEEVFQPLIKEFNFLEKKGIVCETADLGDKRVYFVLNYIRGDNLGVHGILGFAECFTATFPCTICRAPKLLTQSSTREDPLLLRNHANYAADLCLKTVKLTGIKEKCVFNKVKSFHVVDNQCVDPMHDTLEGVSHYVLIPVLKHCVDSKFFSVSTLNARMFFFDYGPCDSSNKPVCISEDFHSRSKLKGTAREILTLVRILGVLVGDLVPDFDPYWHLYILHKQIIQICQAKHLPLAVADELDILIDEHHSLYLQLSGRTLPPKFHYLTHYGRIIRNGCPPSHLSSMRGEAKHREVVTKYASAMSCRKNLPLSVATKHQLGMCFRFISKPPLLPVMICGPGETIDLEDHQYFSDIKSKLPLNFRSEKSVHRVNWVEFSGTLYKPRMVLVYGVSSDSTRYKFGKVIDIFISLGKPLFVCQRLINIGFNEHVGGFEISFSKGFTCFFHEQLFDPFPLYDFTMCTGEKYVVFNQYL